MLKQGTFINKKFNRLLLGNIWGWLAFCINLMTDSLVSGNQLGEVSLQAVTIVFPLFSVIYFFSCLIAPGASIIFGKRIGEFRQEDAYRAAGTSVVASLIIGILLAFSLWLIKDPFLSYYGCTGELYTEAAVYYNWLIFCAFLFPFYNTLYYLTVTDGEALLLTVGEVSNNLFNIVFSIVFSRLFGIAGLGMATCIGLIADTLSYSVHFLKKSNNVKFRLCLDMKTTGRSILLGFSRYMTWLFMAVVDIVMNKIIITTSGVMFIPAYSVVNLVFSVCECFGAMNDAGMGMVTCFIGEKNNHDMNLVFRKTTFSTLIMATVITAFFFFGAPLMPIVYGLTSPETVSAAVTTARIMAFAALGYGAVFLSSELSCSVEKPWQAGLLEFLREIFSPLLLSLIFGFLFGFTGIVIGMCLSPYFAFGIFALIQIPRKGKKGFPLYVEDFGEEGISFDLYVTKDSIIEVREWLHGNLEARGFDTEKTDLLIEEFYTRVMEKNPGRKVLSECTLLFKGDVVRIIIRDDGTLFNFVDENNPVESLNAHVLNSLLEQTKEKNYVLTTSFNRNGFVFEKSN